MLGELNEVQVSNSAKGPLAHAAEMWERFIQQRDYIETRPATASGYWIQFKSRTAMRVRVNVYEVGLGRDTTCKDGDVM